MIRSADELRNKLCSTVGGAVQEAVTLILRSRDGDPGERVPEAVHLGLNVALTSMTMVLPFLAKRPNLTKEQVKERGATEVAKLVNDEMMLFCALIVAKMHGGVKVDDEGVTNEEGEYGVGIAQEVNFGPHTMSEALEAWKKVTGKNPADFIATDILEAIAEGERMSLAPFEAFLNGRKAAPSSNTLN